MTTGGRAAGEGRARPSRPAWGLWSLHWQGGLILCAFGIHRKVKPRRNLAPVCARCRWEQV